MLRVKALGRLGEDDGVQHDAPIDTPVDTYEAQVQAPEDMSSQSESSASDGSAANDIPVDTYEAQAGMPGSAQSTFSFWSEASRKSVDASMAALNISSSPPVAPPPASTGPSAGGIALVAVGALSVLGLGWALTR